MLSKERIFSDVLLPQERERISKIYARLILFRASDDGPELLMQRNDHGKLIFPGGLCRLSDGDVVEALVREFDEETQAERLVLRNIRNVGLLFYSRWFFLDWGEGLVNRDVYFILKWKNTEPQPFGDINDTDQELNWMGWVPLSNLVGEKCIKGQLYKNTKKACVECKKIIDGWGGSYI